MFDVTTDTFAVLNGTTSNTEFNGTDTTWKDANTAGCTYWVCNVIVVIIGVVGNSMVLLLMGDVKFVSFSYPVYLRFLAVSDSVVLIMLCVRETTRRFQSTYLIGTNLQVCALSKFVKDTVTLLSPWLVVGLTVDRFFCVVFPMKRGRICTRTKATIACSCLTILSVLTMFPLLGGAKILVESEVCFVKDTFVVYFTFIRLILTASLPCLLILVFNIVIGIHIQRSVTFRKRFTSTSSGSRENKQDRSLRPLMLISILAFVTLLPLSIVESCALILLATNSDIKVLKIIAELWSPFNILNLVNFGQNFYILMSSSANYRDIMKRKLRCIKIRKQHERTRVARISMNVQAPAYCTRNTTV
ncbi:neuropeptide CCHamide-1 receptor-like [Gigantopelta aegis]|uniref:neuropeptide CCHamide-1 receptor-like n=1 Tax=Gigantopelta aegis TaxID=1735272 RepID=UPI001B88DD3D|nr:neuropeptide CCHamide-1 receptor-like [Gigantopelta aegis]